MGYNRRFRVRIGVQVSFQVRARSSSSRGSSCSAPPDRCGWLRRAGDRCRLVRRRGRTGRSRALDGASAPDLLATRTALFCRRGLRRAPAHAAAASVAVPQQNFVGVADRRLAQHAGGRRGQRDARATSCAARSGTPEAPLLAALGQRFVPRVFRFSSSAERLQTPGDLTFQGTGTRAWRCARSGARGTERPAGRRSRRGE